MSVGSADLHKAVNTVWNASGLDAVFQALYSSGVDSSDFSVLIEQEASPGQPFPYCVFQQVPGTTTARMSGEANKKWEIHDIPWEFRIHTKVVSGDSRTAKEIAGDLAEEVIKIFGGHPSVNPTPLVLDNGNFLISQYQNDFGTKTEDNNYQWNIAYIFRLDVPVAV